MIKVKLFASLREQLDCAQVNLDYSGEHNVNDVKQSLLNLGEQWQLLSAAEVLCAVNQTLSGSATHVHDGDEVAFFPPVTGG